MFGVFKGFSDFVLAFVLLCPLRLCLLQFFSFYKTFQFYRRHQQWTSNVNCLNGRQTPRRQYQYSFCASVLNPCYISIFSIYMYTTLLHFFCSISVFRIRREKHQKNQKRMWVIIHIIHYIYINYYCTKCAKITEKSAINVFTV